MEKNTVLAAGTTSRRGTRLSCVPSMLGSWEVKADGGEGLAKRKGIAARWCLKEAWSKTAT